MLRIRRRRLKLSRQLERWAVVGRVVPIGQGEFRMSAHLAANALEVMQVPAVPGREIRACVLASGPALQRGLFPFRLWRASSGMAVDVVDARLERLSPNADANRGI